MKKFFSVTILIIFLCLRLIDIGSAADPIVQAILFYSPTCPHCHEVIENILPTIKDQYGIQLQLLGIDTSKVEGRSLYEAAIIAYDIPDNRLGVPALIIGDNHLVGSLEIEEQFPGLIEQGLIAGGIGWPEIPGLYETIPDLPPSTGSSNGSEIDTTTVESEMLNAQNPELPSETSSSPEKDTLGSGLAWIVLIGMIIALIYVIRNLFQKNFRDLYIEKIPRSISIPILSIIGFGIASYLSYIEITSTKAVCGPVGECNIVQSSDYAQLFGIPIAVLGLSFYLVILGIWIGLRFLLISKNNWTGPLLIILSIIGTMFSVYLTILEIFIINAVCAWCLMSAIVTTMLMVIITANLLIKSGKKSTKSVMQIT